MSSERPPSGSRWEPADPVPAAEHDGVPAPADGHPEATPHAEGTATGSAVGPGTGAAHPGDTATATLAPEAPASEAPPWGFPAFAAAGPGAGAPLWTNPLESPTPRGRKLLAAGAAVVLLAIGGAGGYWVGHATAPTAAAGAGTHLRHGFGPGRGDGTFGGPNANGPNANGTGGTGTGTGPST